MNRGSVFSGIGIGMAVSLLAPAALALVVAFAPTNLEWLMIALFCIGVLQLVWIVPMVVWFRRKGQTETAKGVVIVAAVVAILNASCWGLLANFRIAG